MQGLRGAGSVQGRQGRLPEAERIPPPSPQPRTALNGRRSFGVESEFTAPPLLLPNRYVLSQEGFWGSPTTYGRFPSRALPHPQPRRGAHGAPGSAPPREAAHGTTAGERAKAEEEERGDRTQPPPHSAPLPGSTRSAPPAAAAVPRLPPSGPAPFRAALAAPGLTWPGWARRLWRRLRRRLGPVAAREGFCRVGRELPAPEPPPAALTHPAAPSERAGRGEGRGGRGQGRGGRSAPGGAAAPGVALKEPPRAAPRGGARGSEILRRFSASPARGSPERPGCGGSGRQVGRRRSLVRSRRAAAVGGPTRQPQRPSAMHRAASEAQPLGRLPSGPARAPCGVQACKPRSEQRY